MKKRLQDPRHSKMLLITTDHLAIVKDYTWLGMNVYSVTDVDLLIEWWNNTLRISETKENEDFIFLSSALWIRINELHPKFKLRFDDITRPELLKLMALKG